MNLTWDLTDLVSWKPLTEAEATSAAATRNCMNIILIKNDSSLQQYSSLLIFNRIADWYSEGVDW